MLKLTLSPFLLTLGPLQLRVSWPVVAAVVAAMAVLARLGVWQLDRAGEKVAEHRALQARLAATAPPLQSIHPDALRPDNRALHNRFVMLEGEYENERSILLLAEFFDGQIGYGVVTPLRLADGGDLALVSRGWTTGILPPGMEPILRPVSGPVRVGAQIHLPDEPAATTKMPLATHEAEAHEAGAHEMRAHETAETVPAAATVSGEETEWPLRVRGLDMEALEAALGEPLFPFELRITADQPGTLARHWPAVNPEVGLHLFYAMQWFLFALLAPIAALFAGSNLWTLLRKPRSCPLQSRR